MSPDCAFAKKAKGNLKMLARQLINRAVAYATEANEKNTVLTNLAKLIQNDPDSLKDQESSLSFDTESNEEREESKGNNSIVSKSAEKKEELKEEENEETV